MNTVLAITVLALAIALAALAVVLKRQIERLDWIMERALLKQDGKVNAPPGVDPRDLVRRSMQDHLTTHHRNDR